MLQNSSADIVESGGTVWTGGQFVPGVAGVYSGQPGTGAHVGAIAFDVGSGEFVFEAF
jgi:hypothetical protein